ncbi:MAG: hypothetical protein AB1Z19_08025, partial [Eubacteriales bacterium]
MKKRFYWTLILSIVLLVVLLPTAAFADSNVSGVVTLTDTDITAGGLQARVEALDGINSASDVTELRIGTDVHGQLNSDDTAYMGTMVNLQVLEVASTVTVEAGIDDFL